MSPTFAGCPFSFPSIVAVLLAVTTAVLAGSVDSPFTIATFSIVPVAFSATVTLKLTTFSSPAFKSIFHFKPITFPVASFISSPLLSIEPDLYSVIAGILSLISIPFNSFSELFFTEISYVISSPFVTKFSPVAVLATFLISRLSYLALIFADANSASISIGVQPT